MQYNIKPFARKRATVQFVADLAAFLLSLALCVGFFGPDVGFETFGVMALLSTLGLYIHFWNKGHYTRKKSYSDELKEVLQGIVVAFIVMLAGSLLLGTEHTDSAYAGIWVLMLVSLPFSRSLACRYLEKRKWTIPTVIIGSGQNAIEAANALQGERHMGLDLKKFLALKQDGIPEDGFLSVLGRKIPVEFAGSDLMKTLLSMGKPHLVVAFDNGGVQKNMDLIERISRSFPHFILFPDLNGLPLYGLEVSHFFRKEVLMLRVHNNLSRRIPRFSKRLFDFVSSLVLLVLLSPVFICLSVWLKMDGGNVFYGHERLGQGGEKFKCYKFRTMVMNADNVLKDILESDSEARLEWEREFKLKKDPRITRIGKFLRESSLDELPQLWNVLLGQMSLVGPRPIVADEVKLYGANINYYLQVKPGMTGLWQVSGRNDASYDKRVALDGWYVKNWALWYDVIIIYQTFGVVLRKSGSY